MYILHQNGLRILVPKAGFKIVNKDKTKVFNSKIYLGKYDSINNYVKVKNISINYEREDSFIIINLNKNIKINTPILNNILGKNYKISTSKAIYE